MNNNIEENKEKLKEKLEYIGLNLERIPKFLTEYKPFSFKPSKSYNDTTYKIYKYVDVNDIQIFLTPANRLTNLDIKYKNSNPIKEYLDSKNEKNIEYFMTFLRLLNDTNIEDIEKIETEQKELKNQIPNQVKYDGNYTWQIYYSDVSNQYFMLVPTDEYSNPALFYLLKKQIESKKKRRKELIFVPISQQDYSGNLLLRSQIADIENYLWYYTKEWPNIFEIYDQKGKMQIKIVGVTNIYEKIKSYYTITLDSKEQAINKYKLIKALFILSTAFPDYYNFNTKVDDKGELEFTLKTIKEEKIINYEKLIDFVQSEAQQKKMLINLEENKIQEIKLELQQIKENVKNQTDEYLSKQCQITTFLECKKTFFGKVKYYFSTRKKNVKMDKKIEEKNTIKKEKNVNENINHIEEKNLYTIEDLIEICTKLESRRKMIKSLQSDKNALKLKSDNLERKIKNANIYLNEIELHKKSIFEFWNFTNKDEVPGLNEGELEEETQNGKIEKIFNYEEDIEEFGKKVDEIQRIKLSKNEADAVFAVKQSLICMQTINTTKSDTLTKEQKQIIENELKNIKKEYEKNITTIQKNDFDVFGGITENATKTLNNTKHREIEKDKYKILNISKQMETDLYIDTLRNYLNLIKEAFVKIKNIQNISGYVTSVNKLDINNLNILHLDANKAIEENINENEIYLYKINIKEGMPILYYSNIMYYDNTYKTLPVGMNLSDEILVDFSKLKLEKINEEEFKINYLQDKYNKKIINVHCIEYSL